MDSKDPRIKNIKIKTGVVKRYAKERIYYMKERDQQEAKINKMKSDNADSHDISKQEEVLRESEMMIPDCLRRLKASYQELQALLDQEAELSEAKEYKEAQAVLEDNKTVVE